jgi:hypothetical protein
MPLNTARVAVGPYQEILEQETNDDLRHAQELTLPITVNGRIAAPRADGAADQDVFTFRAKKGQQLSFTVAAQALGSPLDSVIEVLDEKGNMVPRVVLRPLLETYTTLSDRDSASAGIRLTSVKGIEVEDYLLAGGELMKVEALPPDPDSDTRLFSFMGNRIAYEGTTPEGHAVDTPVYKVALHKPGEELPAGGMRPVTLYYRNDDGGLMYGKDAHLDFTVPADGLYYLRLKDVRGLGGDAFAYRLTVAEAAPDYALTVSPPNPNVPVGGSVAVTVTAHRIDGFDGRIDVQVEGLPKGLMATTGTILPGHYTTMLTISCAPDVTNLRELTGIPWRVTGRAHIGDREVARAATTNDMISLVSVTRHSELAVSVDQSEVVLEPGGAARVTVSIRRLNGFAGRVPVEVRNLPRGTTVKVGLNGVLITEDETRRAFQIEASPNAAPLEQQIYVLGRIETNSSVRSEYAAPPIKLRIVPRRFATGAGSNKPE